MPVAALAQKQGSRRILMYGQAILLRHMGTKKVQPPLDPLSWLSSHAPLPPSSSSQLLRCLSSSPAGDKLAYEIGFTEQPDKRKRLSAPLLSPSRLTDLMLSLSLSLCTPGHVDESCWFIVRPASKQRSEGEKVRTCTSTDCPPSLHCLSLALCPHPPNRCVPETMFSWSMLLMRGFW